MMKKTLLIAAASTLSLSISSALYAGDIEKAERYEAPLEQNVVEMDVNVVEGQTEMVSSNFEMELGSNAEVQELGLASIGEDGARSSAEVQELGRGGWIE